MILLLKIVSSLNGFSQSVVSDSPRYRAAVAVKKYIIFQKKMYYFQQQKNVFGKKMIFWLIFLGHIPRKTTYVFFGYFFVSSSAEDDLWKTT